MAKFSSFPKADPKPAPKVAPAADAEPDLVGPELEFAEGAPGAPSPPVPPQAQEVPTDLNITLDQSPAAPSQESAGVSSFQGDKEIGDKLANALPKKAASPADTVTDEFVSYLHKVEGGERHINKQGQWMPYNTDGAGKWTIGRGHLINGGKSPKGWEQGLTSDEVEELFREDVIIATNQARKDVGAVAFDALPLKSRQLLVDFSFNLGSSWSKKFPKMTRAVLAGDMEGAYNQMERWKTAPSGVKSRLKGRNAAVADYFFGKVDGDAAPDASATLPSDRPDWTRP